MNDNMRENGNENVYEKYDGDPTFWYGKNSVHYE